MPRIIKIGSGIVLFVSLISATIFAQDLGRQLLEAVEAGNAEATTALLAKAGGINAKDRNGKTVLMREVYSFSQLWYVEDGREKEHAGIVNVLLALGADVNARDNYNFTALLLAANTGNIEIITILLAHGAEVNAKAYNGQSALMSAAGIGHTEIVKLLLAKGAEVNTRGHNGRTALMMTAQGGHAETVTVLLANGADINAKDNNGKTVLMWAVSYYISSPQKYESEHAKTVGLLLSNGASTDVKDNGGRTALAWAEQSGHAEIATLLKQAGAKE
jgi:ankyrin repeat protein